ncbi:olfactory receptor 1-like [Erpetoichthys calabaricus]|uniref:olfactory receptor 1-like n=1 Tax=Erpetoichthys calabaricus TaxID=27687 RepID=UPI0022344CB2|nr:olfactory receptor 1-like [Erpetoichthys calabaricus]
MSYQMESVLKNYGFSAGHLYLSEDGVSIFPFDTENFSEVDGIPPEFSSDSDSMKMSNTISNASITISEFILQCAIESNHNNVMICILMFIYFISMFGNLMVIVVIILNPQLHAPMYLYIGTLAVIDLANSSILVPKMVSVLLGSPVVPYAACVLQMVLVPHVEEMESFLLVFMAFDRYVAVVYPLQYPSAITNKKVGIGVLVSNIFGIVLKLHLLIFVSELSFCRTNILPFCFCDYATMVHMSCNEEPKHLSSLSTIVAIFAVFPLIFIFISYSRIAIEALKISSAGGKGTGVRITRETYNVMFILGNAVPCMMNPIIYSFRNKEINKSIQKLFARERSTLMRRK